MTDYSKMTDDEINHLIMIQSGLIESVDYPYWYFDPQGESHDSDLRGPLRRVVDYCNSWVAIGPIVESSNISLEHESLNGNSWGDEKWVACCDFRAFGVLECVSAFDKNPKRAAAICFLMMQEAKG